MDINFLCSLNSLSEEEKAELKELNKEKARAQKEIINFWRNLAKKRGVFVALLAEFKTDFGRFVEQKNGNGYRRAVLKKVSPFNSWAPRIIEEAYYCPDCNGWIKGTPRKEACIDSITDNGVKPGLRFCCQLCGRPLAIVPESKKVSISR